VNLFNQLFKTFYNMATAQPTVKTVQFTDPRIEPQPDPVYDYVIAPTQNQFYKIAASSLSNSSISFNNLTTLGVDRAYLDTFELELTATFDFTIEGQTQGQADRRFCPAPNEWTFDSFPFNKCCDSIHVNINGGAFFSQPLSYLRAKERYMDQAALSKCYENVCPIHRAICQYESGDDYTRGVSYPERVQQYNDSYITLATPPVVGEVQTGYAYGTMTGTPATTYTGAGVDTANCLVKSAGPAAAKPTRYGIGIKNYMQSPEGLSGGFNNSIVRLGKGEVYDPADNLTPIGYQNYHFRIDEAAGQKSVNYNHMIVTVTWREPIFCSPFSSRYDATYGRPLYNITSMDLTFTLQGLENMIRLAHINYPSTYVSSYSVNIDSAQICYQVMTIPPIMKKPLTTLVPYRRFVPYITDFTSLDGAITPSGGKRDVTMSSGVYTFNEIPTAIWLFVAPSKKTYQTCEVDAYTYVSDTDYGNCLKHGNFDSNKLFGTLNHVSISMANTTQILNTADPVDLYRIAKANGCQDSYLSWRGDDVLSPKVSYVGDNSTPGLVRTHYQGAGSVLRLIPGVDLIVPDQALIPGANANNMVFKVDLTCTIPPHAPTPEINYSLWLLFEYVGVASISPGQCEITMNPLGSGEIMAASPIVSGTSDATEGNLEGGAGWLDKLVRGMQKANQTARETGIVSKILKLIPSDTTKKAGDWAEKLGYGDRGCKRARGGAVMGKGLADWSV
jgi:hypothetical protein